MEKSRFLYLGFYRNSNVYKTLFLKCPKCSCCDYYKICPLCDHQILINLKHAKAGYIRCEDCGAIITKTLRHIPYSYSNQPLFYSFCNCFSRAIKFFCVLRNDSVWFKHLAVACFNWSFLSFLNNNWRLSLGLHLIPSAKLTLTH